MKHLFLIILTSLALPAFGQVKNVQKSPFTNELTEALKTGTQTITISEAGGLTVENDALVSGLIQPGDNISSLANDAGYLTSVAWSDVTSKPTTLSGYGITDAVPNSRTLTAGAGLAGGGDLTANRSVSLSAGSIASLALADSSMQPGDNMSELINDADYVVSPVDLTIQVTGLLPDSNISSAATWNAKQAAITGGASTITTSNLTISRALASDASGKVAVSATTSAELGYLSGVTSAVQTQLAGKQATVTGAATTIVTSNLTAGRAVVTDFSGKVAASSTTSAEVGYLSGVTSALQTQLNGKIGGSTGSTDNALLGANGTGGATLKAFDATYNPTTQLMRIGSSSGWVHIGRYSPDSYGAIYFNQATPSGINWAFLGDASATYFNAPISGKVVFRINNTSKMAVGPTGYVGIGLEENEPAATLGVSTSIHAYGSFSSNTIFEGIAIVPGVSANEIKPIAGGAGGTARPTSYHTTSGGVRVMSGSGTPESAVSAPVGSIYTRTDGGANTTLYVKESGTGNTGWIAK